MTRLEWLVSGKESITLTITVNGDSGTKKKPKPKLQSLIKNSVGPIFRSVTGTDGRTVQVGRLGTIEGAAITFTGIAAIQLKIASCRKNSLVTV